MTEIAGAKRGPGRVSTYDPVIADAIVDRISDGEPLAVICRDGHMPAYRTVYDWQAAHPEFAASIARARKVGFDMIAERARLTIRGKRQSDGGESTGDVQRDKAIVDTDLKLLAKWDPRRYGDKIAHVGGGPDDAPIRHEIDLTGLSDEELEQLERIRSKLAQPGSDQGGEGA